MKTSGSGDYLFRLDAGGNPTLLGRPVVEDDERACSGRGRERGDPRRTSALRT